MYGRIDEFQREELEPSWCSQLDFVGRQPHAREYLEYQINATRGERKFEQTFYETIDYPDGIHFGDSP